jgi:hypothetical protein
MWYDSKSDYPDEIRQPLAEGQREWTIEKSQDGGFTWGFASTFVGTAAEVERAVNILRAGMPEWRRYRFL